MSQHLDLPDPIFDALSRAAADSGTTPVGWIAAHLPEAKPATANGAKTLADLFAGRTDALPAEVKPPSQKSAVSDSPMN